MISDLTAGTVVVFKYNGAFEMWEVQDCPSDPSINPKYAPPGSKAYSRCFRALPAGEVVHRCVWKKGDTLVSRETYTVKEGDVQWNSIGPAKDVTALFKHPVEFSKHTFAPTTPKWLREAR